MNCANASLTRMEAGRLVASAREWDGNEPLDKRLISTIRLRICVSMKATPPFRRVRSLSRF